MASITVRVTPRASRDAITAYTGGVLHVRVTAPPAGGEANAAVTRLLARALGLPPRDISLAAGATARVKRFVAPVEPADLDRLLQAACTDHR